ncbi:very short patch repair endonuclease [Rhizobium leguminosarum]|uniref:very short patch repair endonuclease n=1 Tax=Rhizobium leguminosarum TaxID=384 RepID=UPI003F969C30
MSSQRGAMMSRVRTKNTGLELTVRQVAHRLGYRFRVNVAKYPGKPDVIFPRFRVALFVHGCFWHGHSCQKGRLPKSNVAFWAEKIEGNRLRDRKNIEALTALGWQSFELWECQTKNGADIESFLMKILPR